MGEINVQSTVINTHLFFCFIFTQYLFIFHQWKVVHIHLWNCFHKLTHLCVVVFILWVHKPFWFVILHRNIQHTKLLGGMCSAVKILSPNYHLFSPLTRLILLWTFRQCIISKLQLKLFNHIIHFSYVLADFPVSVNGVSAAFTQFIIAWFGDSITCFVVIYLWPFHCFTKSSLCVGDLLPHHTPHIRVTHFRWPAL